MGSSSKRARRRRRAQESLERGASRPEQEKDSNMDSEVDMEGDQEVLFPPKKRDDVVIPPTTQKVLEVPDCTVGSVTSMVRTLNNAIAAVSQDTAHIQQAYQQLCRDNVARDKALADLTAMVKEYGESPAATRAYGSSTPKINTDVLDGDGNLRAADIGITWSDNKTFLHGVRIVGSKIPGPAGNEPVMSTPYPERGNDGQVTPSMTGRPSSPETIEFGLEIITVNRPAADQLHRPTTESRQGYRPAAPIQRFNNKSLNWPAWFRHFRAVADVHGWSKEQRALQLVSYLDETAMNVAQELGDHDLYNYDILVKLLGERFDPASRVSASRSRFHARSRRHHEDADTFADTLTELCRVGYPQSPPELRQELVAEQFVRGQSDPELKKYLWVVIRTQKERKLQTLIEVCTDFSSLVSPSHLHRPAEQTFAVHQQAESYTEETEEQEDIFAVGDRPLWNKRITDTPTSPSLQQMFALARRMGYEMRPIANQQDAQRRPPGSQPPPDQHRGFRPPARTGRDFSRIKCFSCGEFGHMQSCCQKLDATLPFRPAGWHLQSDNRPTRDGNNSPRNS